MSINSDEWCPVAAMQPCGHGPENASDVGYIRRIDAVVSAQLIRGLWQVLRSEGGFTSAKADDSSSLGDRCGRGERHAGASGPGGAWPGRWIWSGVVLISARTHTSTAELMRRGARGVFLSSGRWGRGGPAVGHGASGGCPLPFRGRLPTSQRRGVARPLGGFVRRGAR